MNKTIRRQLKTAFAAPEPQRKNAFLRACRRREIGMGTLYLIQARYISPAAWALSAAALFLGALLPAGTKESHIWTASAVMPVLALAVLTEGHKSRACRMTELEAAARFSLSTVMMARMAILGVCHLVIIVLLALTAGVGFTRNLVYLLVPYLLTANLGSVICRRTRGREAVYGCAAVSAAVSMAGITAYWQPELLFASETFGCWCAMLAAVTIAGTANFIKSIKEREHLDYGTDD